MTYVDDYITDLENTLKAVSRSEIQAVVDFLFDALFDDRQVFIIGNGGSASTASHMMNDLSKLTIRPGKPRYRAIALTDNMPLISAWGNDVSYDSVFTEPLRNLMRPADILVAISTSGNSPNILRAIECVHKEFLGTVIAITGNKGGVLADVSDLVVRIPSEHIGHQEDGHLIVNHVVCNALAERIDELE